MASQSNVLSPLNCEVQLPELEADSSFGNQTLSLKNKKGWKTGIERSSKFRSGRNVRQGILLAFAKKRVSSASNAGPVSIAIRSRSIGLHEILKSQLTYKLKITNWR
ncbi:MAG: hypothetical protein HC849_16165 [Oscillatoriales cyanobacterium RU_3_3]|nr:hypothetical protein [Microcoleus sp. SU_5_6]NJL66123.1 hypothetical protein [Microcoleus sp. SM1_3_4]NJM61380.1 hypothetical protein [Oscillatoriales cyanobacterium RU_3_3]NJR24040.1 hypothetical protein [Richelia sp. CSU_2_1]